MGRGEKPKKEKKEKKEKEKKAKPKREERVKTVKEMERDELRFLRYVRYLRLACLILLLIHVLIGLVLLAMGLLFEINPPEPCYEDAPVTFSTVLIIICLYGVLHMSVALLALYAVWARNKEMMMVAVFLLLALAVIVLMLLIFTIYYRYYITELTEYYLYEFVLKYDQSVYCTELMDDFQYYLTCCGVNNHTDWHRRYYDKDGADQADEQRYSRTCCDVHNEPCSIFYGDHLHKEPCLEPVVALMAGVAAIAIVIFIVLLMLLLLAAIFIVGYRMVLDEKEDDNYSLGSTEAAKMEEFQPLTYEETQARGKRWYDGLLAMVGSSPDAERRRKMADDAHAQGEKDFNKWYEHQKRDKRKGKKKRVKKVKTDQAYIDPDLDQRPRYMQMFEAAKKKKKPKGKRKGKGKGKGKKKR